MRVDLHILYLNFISETIEESGPEKIKARRPYAVYGYFTDLVS